MVGAAPAEVADLVVAGAGPAGRAAAGAAAAAGARVVLVTASGRGAAGASGVAVWHGRARVAGPGPRGQLVVDVDLPEVDAAHDAAHPAPALPPLQARAVVLATGLPPARPALPGLAEVRLQSPADVLAERVPPRSVAVLGGGAAGCRLALALLARGSKVTVVAAGDGLLDGAPPEAGHLLERLLRDGGARVVTGALVTTAAPTLDGGAFLGVGSGDDVAADRVVLAATDRTHTVAVDAQLATATAGVFAAGAVTGAELDAATAAAMGRAAATRALAHASATGRRAAAPRTSGTSGTAWDAGAVPVVIPGPPEVAWVGRAAWPDAAGVTAPPLTWRSPDGPEAGTLTLHARRPSARSRLPWRAPRPAGPPLLVGAVAAGPGAGLLIEGLALAIRYRVPLDAVLAAPRPELPAAPWARAWADLAARRPAATAAGR